MNCVLLILHKSYYNKFTLCFSALLKIDGHTATQDKIGCVVKCSKKIFKIIKMSKENNHPISADDFFPSLIYVCLKANPARIQSNINFVQRFANDGKLRMGEGGYFFANLVIYSFIILMYRCITKAH